MLEDDYGSIRTRRDVWAFTEYAPSNETKRKDNTTDADIIRIMSSVFPDRSFEPSLFAQIRAAAKARAENPVS